MAHANAPQLIRVAHPFDAIKPLPGSTHPVYSLSAIVPDVTVLDKLYQLGILAFSPQSAADYMTEQLAIMNKAATKLTVLNTYLPALLGIIGLMGIIVLPKGVDNTVYINIGMVGLVWSIICYVIRQNKKLMWLSMPYSEYKLTHPGIPERIKQRARQIRKAFPGQQEQLVVVYAGTDPLLKFHQYYIDDWDSAAEN